MAKILFVSDVIMNGGASKMLLWVAGTLTKQNCVDVCYLAAFKPEYVPSDIRVFRLRNDTNKSDFLSRNTIGLVRNVKSISALIKNGKYDLVISFGDHSFYPLVISKLFCRFKLLVSERVDPYSVRKLSDTIRRKLYRYADFMVFQTQQAADYFKNMRHVRSAVIHNPATGTVERSWEYKEEAKYVITVGRIDIFQKRQDVLLEAFKKVHSCYPSYKLRIIGGGDDKVELLKLIEKNGLNDCVEYLGYKKHDEINELMRNAHLFVLSSDFEGIPNALIEALQIGIPIVSTDCSPGGASLLLDNGKHGILVKRGDAVALSNGIEEALSSKEIIIRMGEMTKFALDRFSEKSIGNDWNKFIKQCTCVL